VTAQLECPTCGKRFDSRQATTTLPFCSERCRLLDLRRWLNEEQGMPLTGDEDQDEDHIDPPERFDGNAV
jgi:uncharacterized protein